MDTDAEATPNEADYLRHLDRQRRFALVFLDTSTRQLSKTSKGFQQIHK
jgi:hypothetical protein